jgi:hypothetical protein
MKLNQKLIVAAITISLFLGFTGMARMRANDILRIAEKSSVEIQIAQNDFSTENDSDILYFGVPEERSPYGFIKTDSKIVSYCKECNCSQQKAGLVENGVIHKPMIHAMWTVIQEDCDQLWIIFQIRKRSPSHPATGLFPRS